MATLNEIAYNILNIINGGKSTNTEPISTEQIKFEVGYYRALILKRDFQDGRKDKSPFEQRLEVEVEVYEPAEHGMIDDDVLANIGQNFVLKAVSELPERVAFHNTFGAIRVATPFGKSIPLIRDFRLPYKQYNKYTSNNMVAYIDVDQLYVVDDTFTQDLNDGTLEATVPMSHVVVHAIFENPLDERLVGSIEDPGTAEYPCTADVVQRITQAILNNEMQLYRASPNDVEANMVEDAKQNT